MLLLFNFQTRQTKLGQDVPFMPLDEMRKGKYSFITSLNPPILRSSLVDCPVSSLSVHLEGHCGERMFDCRDVVFIVGEGEDHDVPIGIDKALEKMQRGEQCILFLGSR